MNTISVRDFRSNMASCLNRIDAGEEIYVRRNNQLYTIIPVKECDLRISTELREKIDAARQAYKEEKTVGCSSHEELDNFFDAL